MWASHDENGEGESDDQLLLADLIHCEEHHTGAVPPSPEDPLEPANWAGPLVAALSELWALIAEHSGLVGGGG
jgi:hypothetical protein